MIKNRQTMKRNRQSKVLNIKNRAAKTALKNVVKEFQAETDLAKKSEILKTALSKFDKAGQRHIIHPVAAARKKSVLTREFNNAQAENKSTE
ncbi:MAG: 30S ribosomal protein S20 [candidate division Zixibacteria bacterium]|nr:30S ribosomal protein S20 [candidate division Zixibacteria bacterium]